MNKTIRFMVLAVFIIAIFSKPQHIQVANAIEMNSERIVLFVTAGVEWDDYSQIKSYFLLWGCNLTVAGLTSDTINPGTDHAIPIDLLISEVDVTQYDCLYIPGGNSPFVLAENQVVIDKVVAAYNEGLYLAAFCSGPLVLAKANLVNGTHVTGYPTVKDELISAGGIYEDVNAISDGKIVTGLWPHMYDFCYCLAKAMGYSYVLGTTISESSDSNCAITVRLSKNAKSIKTVLVNVSYSSSVSEMDFVKTVELNDGDKDGNYTAEVTLDQKEGKYYFDVTVEDYYGNIDIQLNATTFSFDTSNKSSEDTATTPSFVISALFVALVIFSFKRNRKKNNT